MLLTLEDKITVLKCKSLCNGAMHAIKLQIQRINNVERDVDFVMQVFFDIRFLIVAMSDLRRSASVGVAVPSVADEISRAILEFNNKVPHLKKLRDVAEHIDEYAIDSPRRHRKEVSRSQTQVMAWDGRIYKHLNVELDTELAVAAAEGLFSAISKIALK